MSDHFPCLGFGAVALILLFVAFGLSRQDAVCYGRCIERGYAEGFARDGACVCRERPALTLEAP